MFREVGGGEMGSGAGAWLCILRRLREYRFLIQQATQDIFK